ncbi:MAG: hypothetical protein E7512_00030 [[Clostridium] sporosphaeroides]|uniref:BclA C-terminal domain-containing protein n=1 Tax=Faecalispora sporosphaeroides TaxID=1549 RepID=A0A928KS85_9FIRM|nr:hypothetical protein [Faecalispora sporosphaeroides]
MQVQLQGSSGGTIADSANVVFDTPINAVSTNITYDTGTGIFSILQPGNYFISWWVNTDGAEVALTVNFGIRVLSGSIVPSVLASSPSPQTTVHLNGSALLTVTTVPTTFSLFNNSAATAFYGTTAIQANLAVIGLT